jgi:hypothetical protein
MTKKILIEVPAEWGDKDMGGYSGAELVNEVQGLVREKTTTKYEEWLRGVTSEQAGTWSGPRRQLHEAAPEMVDVLVQMKRRLTHAAGAELLEDLGVIRVLKLAFPDDVAEEVLDPEQEPYTPPHNTQCEAFTGIGAGPRCQCRGVWRYRVTDYKGVVTMEILCGIHYRQRRGDHCVRNIEHTGRKLA